jgi:hypothetical protein
MSDEKNPLETIFGDYLNWLQSETPSAADLDAVAAEESIKEQTADAPEGLATEQPLPKVIIDQRFGLLVVDHSVPKE